MTAFWRGLPGGGLVYENRPGSVQMVWDLQKGWFWDGMLSAVHDDMVSRGIVSEGIMSKQKSGEMCQRLSCTGIVSGIISTVISLLISLFPVPYLMQFQMTQQQLV